MHTSDYARVERAIRFLAANWRRQPSLAEVARHAGLSEFHFQRLFTRWAGISPKRFVQFLTADHARRLLAASESVLDVAGEVGLSGPSRLHDLIVAVDAVTPGEMKAGGAGLTVRYGVAESPFGECLMGVTGRGLCWLSFVHDGGRRAAVGALRDHWRGATLVEDPGEAARVASRVFEPADRTGLAPLPVLLRGTNFQIKVWEALLRVPAGGLTTYGDLAGRIGAPRATRAVGTAVAHNPIAYVIPCHRVIRATGEFGEYRWGAARKQAMLGWELAREAPDGRKAV
jgi:AraC family transcriptional regulator of adaptative response/methylated-DNA-[protein]-cysteine methyltransferase